MSLQEYIVIPMHPKEAARVERELRVVVKNLLAGYHDMKPSPEKEEIGNTIHDLNSAISKFREPQYKQPWAILEKIYYPNKKKA